MKSNVIFRLATPHDNAFIYQALKDMALEENIADRFTLSEEKLNAALFSEKAFAEVLLAILDDQPVGLIVFSMTHRNFDIFSAPGIYIHNLYTVKSFRKNKIGTQLIEQIKKIALKRNCGRVDWVVLKNNKDAINFYKNIPGAHEVNVFHYMRITL
jgi:GNAT superfamily N-acetyltransferase